MNPQPANQPNPQVEQFRRMFNGLGRGRQVSVVAAVLGFIISLVLPWFGASGLFSENGWHSWGWLAVLAFIVAGVVVLLPLFGISLRNMVASMPPTVTDARIVMGAGVVAVIATILFIITGGGYGTGPGYGPSFGAYLGLLCGIAIAVGGYLMQQEPSPVL